MIDLLQAKRKCLPMRGVLRIGGDSDSEQSQVDGRITGGNESVNGSAAGDNSTVNIRTTTTDFGAVGKSLDLAMKGVDSSAALATEVVKTNAGTVGKVFDGTLDVLKGSLSTMAKQQDSFTSAFTSQGSAFGTALENVKTSDTRVLILAGLAVVGLVGMTLLKKGG